jgi:hypothetical protein
MKPAGVANAAQGSCDPRFRRRTRLLILLAGIFAGQIFLYGPSLIGRKILLPLDVLAQPNFYLPQTADTAKQWPHDIVLSDLVLQFETERRFVAGEMREGRFPLWLPISTPACHWCGPDSRRSFCWQLPLPRR